MSSEVATAPRAAELLSRNKSWKNRNDLVAFSDVAIEKKSFYVKSSGCRVSVKCLG